MPQIRQTPGAARLLHTTAIRLALRYAIYYGLLTSLGLGVLYWATSRYVDAQISAGLEQALAALIQTDQRQGRKNLVRILNAPSGAGPENRRYTLLVSAHGEKLAGDLKKWPESLRADRQVRNVWIEDKAIPVRVADKDGYWPMIAARLADGSRLLIAQSVRQAEDLQEFILSAMSIILLVIVGLTLLLGWRMGRRMLERVDLINATAREIQRGDLSQRISPSERNDEFDELAAHLNRMLDHIERLVGGMREVTDNVAHDLRRPLTRLRTRLEITLLEARDERQYRDALNEAVADVEDMIGVFNALLDIARAEAGSQRGEWEVFDLSALVRNVGGLYRDAADEAGEALRLTIEDGLRVTGNAHLMGQAVSNLLENARKYGGRGGAIEMRLSRDGAYAALEIADNGPGVPADQRQRVLQRFMRLDSARSTSGNGLGLSLVAAVASLHEAILTLGDNHPGLLVSLSIPLAATLPNGKGQSRVN